MTPLPQLDMHAHPVQAGRHLDDGRPAVLAVTFSAEEWAAHADSDSRERLIWGLGLHPWETYTDDDVARTLERLPQCDAIGEIGLDGTVRAKRPMPKQHEALVALLDAPEAKDRVVSVHGLRAYAEVVRILESHPTPGVIFHWFMGMDDVLRRAVRLDIFFSVNQAMFALTEGRAVIAELPMSRVLIETDAPYIERASGQSLNPDDDLTGDSPLRPGEVGPMEKSLSELWGIDPAGVREQLWQNLSELEGRLARPPFSASRVLNDAR